VPGAATDPGSIRIDGLEDWERDLAIEMVLESEGVVRGHRQGIYLVPLFQSGLESNFARLPERTTTMRLRVRGPGRAIAPEPGELRGPAGASATLAVAEQGGAVLLDRRVRVPLAAIPVAQYDDLVQFCRAAAQIEQRTVAFVP
jgi:hypothetical protein